MSSATAVLMTLLAAPAASEGEVLDFTATWCGPCQSVAPIVAGLERQGYPIRRIDIDAHPELAAKYRIQSIPQFVLVVDGEVRERLLGIQSESKLKSLLAKVPRREPETSSTEIAEVKQDSPTRRWGLPIPFLGRDEPIEPPKVESVRAQNDGDEQSERHGPNTAEPMDASVRVNVTRNGAVNHGSGTIIDSTSARTLIATCGHVLRNSDRATKIAVDVFHDDKFDTYPAQVIQYDDKADVGLIAIQPGRLLPVAVVASSPGSIQTGDLVFSVGCGNGDVPSKWQMYVKQVFNSNGAGITECTSAPVFGRSGGGLFNRKGELIGVCSAADKSRNTGLYAGLEEIHRLLDRTSLTALYHRKSEASPPTDGPAPFPSLEETTVAEATPVFADAEPSGSKAITPPAPLSEDEVAAIAAALQFSGRQGVTIEIDESKNSPENHRILIVAHAPEIRTPSAVESALASQTKSEPTQRPSAVPAVDLAWGNDLELSHTEVTRRVERPAPPATNDMPEWAQEHAPSSPPPEPYRRSVR